MKLNTSSLLLLLTLNTCSFARYYSQFEQDSYANDHFFKNKKDGFFVDIGAHDGITCSNSLFFEQELGWSGICFEPVLAPFENLKKIRKCICLNAGIASSEGELDFIQVAAPLDVLSGLVKSYHPGHLIRMKKEVAECGGSYSFTKIPCLEFNTVMRQYNVNHIDFLSIDTEGNELDILTSINFETIKIAVITVENNYGEKGIKSFLEAKGYLQVALLGCDELYVNYAVLNKPN